MMLTFLVLQVTVIFSLYTHIFLNTAISAYITRMWADVQRDGLLNATEFG